MSDQVNCNKICNVLAILNQSVAGQSAKGILINQLSMFTMVYTTSI